MEIGKQQRIHFIAIGGSVMHNLAIALNNNGFVVSGSDDEIFEPAAGNLEKNGILPDYVGWKPEVITRDLDAVILGMHARLDNPELKKARELDIPVFSFPDYIFNQSLNKQRIVIAGSHGKTTITAMILHVLKYLNRDFDYLIGAHVEGFETMVRLSKAPIIILEGDEYFSSPLDRVPKFLRYHHHIGLISGVAWDHMNVFPTFEDYVKQFDIFADATPKAGTLIYCEDDPMATVVCSKERTDVTTIDYKVPPYTIENGTYILNTPEENVPLKIFGKHNMQNIAGAREVLKRIGVTNEQFNEAINSFKGAANRLELIKAFNTTSIFRDFAHAPSKVEATVNALKEQGGDKKLVACLELHTFSSLNKKFLPQYQDTLAAADLPIVYFNPKTIEHKKLEQITEAEIINNFKSSGLKVYTHSAQLREMLLNLDWHESNLLLMSSGNFDGMDIQNLAEEIQKISS